MTTLGRFLQIVLAVWGHLLWWGLVRLHVWPAKVTPAQRLKRTLARLGGTFIKLGQGLSLHRDLLPDDYVQALQDLQDHVPPFPAALARSEIETAFGHGIEQLLAEFEDAPLAAASIAQVHSARMRDGRRVVVKVRRPGIKAQVERDLRLLTHALCVALLLYPWLRQFDPLGIIAQIRANLQRETDFRLEARNIEYFAEAFHGSASVHIPGVVDRLYTESVIVQELSGGRRVDDPALRTQGAQLAQAFVEAYLQQVFVLGVFHGDPHPGNLFIMGDGHICFHDFGLVGRLDSNTRRNLAAFLLAFAYQDGEWLLDAALDLGLLAGEIDRGKFRRGLAEITQDYAATPLKDWSLAEAFVRVVRLGRGRHIRLPHHLLVLMRALFEMENVVRSLDPEFNLMEGLLGKAEKMLQGAATGGRPQSQYRAPKVRDRAQRPGIPGRARRMDTQITHRRRGNPCKP